MSGNIEVIERIAAALKDEAMNSPENTANYIAAIAILQGIENTRALSENVVYLV